MDSTPKRVFAILLLISVVYFILFIFPNNTGAGDEIMVSLFAADEFTQYQVVTRMLSPREALDKTILNFIAYRHYYYGSTFYFSSALTILPAKLIQGYWDTQLNMLLLRQVINVLPMLAALLLLTYVQTGFRSYAKSIMLFVFLLALPAVVKNNLWWHVDSLAVLFIILTFYFLDRDHLRFERNFYFAAVSIGLATSTKVIGLFFFLAIPTYLLVGLMQKRIAMRTVFVRGAVFLAVMALTIFISNPFQVIPGQFERMIMILSNQSAAISRGWTMARAIDPASWLPIIEELYGRPIFMALALFALGLGAWRGANRLLHLLIAAWAIPFGLYVLFGIAIKPPHYLLAILLPVISSVVVLTEFLPSRPDRPRKSIAWVLGGIILALAAWQFAIHIKTDAGMVRETLTREQTEQSLVFYRSLESEYLPQIKSNERLIVFRDIRMYFPDDPRWSIRSYWNANYSIIEKTRPDLMILWSQRVLDYTQDNIEDQANDPAAFEEARKFYMDARYDQLQGYRLVYSDPEGMFFVSDAIHERYFK